jgi:aminoglycoside phosphotransferase (APT) family kinase protein
VNQLASLPIATSELHADLHEAQLLVDDGALTGIIDWQTATVGHPYLEFNFGEWGTRIWRDRRADLPELRRRQWTAYAAERGLDAAHADVFEWVWCAQQLAVTQRNEANRNPRPEITGTVDEARAAFEAASTKLV